MAAQPVGTIFAEIGIDYTPATRAQEQLLKDATSTSTNIEQNFKNLGIKSAAEFDLLRQKVTNSFDMISGSGKASADDIIRAEEAKNAKLSALNAQQFGEHSSFLDTLKSHYLAVAAVSAVAVGTITEAWGMAKAGAKFEEQTSMLDGLSRKYGTTADSIVSDMERASNGLISKADLMQIALGGIAKGLTPDQLTNLADAAEILGKACGKDATEALQDLTQALETGRTKGLISYTGTALDLKEVFGDLTGKLTLHEKALAMYNLTVIEAAKRHNELGEAVLSSADKMEQIDAKFKNAMLSVSTFAKTAVVGLIDGFKATFLSGNDAGESLTVFGQEAEKAATSVDKTTESTKRNTEENKKSLDAIKAQVQARKDDAEAAKKAAEDIKRQDEMTIKNLVAMEEQKNIDYSNAMAKAQEIDINYYNNLKTLSDKSYWETMTALEKETEERAKALHDEFFEEEKVNKERIKDTQSLYKEIKGYEKEAYAASLELINEKAEKYRKEGVDEVSVANWVSQEMQNAYIKMLSSGGDFFGGIHAGYLKMQTDAQTAGQIGFEAFKTFTDASKTAVSDGLFQAIKTGTIDTGAIFEAFSDKMLHKFTDTVADMVTNAAAKDISLLFDAKWTVDGSAVIAMLTKLGGWISGLWGGSGGMNTGAPAEIGADLGGGATTAFGMASGGQVQPGKPVWVGEQGPELLFPGGSGYVLPHGASMAYAARNGGFIPGFAEGGSFAAGDPGLYRDILQRAASGGNISYDEAFMASMSVGKHFAYAPTNDYQKALLMMWARDPAQYADADIADMVQVGDNLKKITYWNGTSVLSAIDTGGTSLLANIFKGVVGAGLSAAFSYGGPLSGAFFGALMSQTGGGGSLDWTKLGIGTASGALAGYLGEGKALTGYDVAKIAASTVGKIGLSYLFGGGSLSGKPEFDISGSGTDNSLGSILARNMSGIAPSSDKFSFPSFHDGGFVPYDMTARLKGGERVQSASEVQRMNGPMEIRVYIGNEEFNGHIKAVADGVIVARNQRGKKLNPVQRVYR